VKVKTVGMVMIEIPKKPVLTQVGDGVGHMIQPGGDSGREENGLPGIGNERILDSLQVMTRPAKR